MARILIVDENPLKAAFLKMTLTRHEHAADRCETHAEAVAKASADGIDLILVHLEPDNGRGWDVVFELRDRLPHTPLMLYVMEHMQTSAVRWIVNAVAEAVGGADVQRRCDSGDTAPPARRSTA